MIDPIALVAIVLIAVSAIVSTIVITFSRMKTSPKKKAKVKKAIEEIKEESKPKAQTAPAIPLPGNNAGFTQLDEIPIGSKIQVELASIVDKDEKKKRVVRAKLLVPIKADALGRVPDLFFVIWRKRAYYLNAAKIIEVEIKKKKILKLICDVLFSEPLNQDGTITWDDNLEGIITDSIADQFIVAATFESTFALTPELQRAIMIIGGLGLLGGLALNGLGHFTPSVVVHWSR